MQYSRQFYNSSAEEERRGRRGGEGIFQRFTGKTSSAGKCGFDAEVPAEQCVKSFAHTAVTMM
jgi:hypothetical protein